VIFSERMTRSQKYVSYGAGQRWVLKEGYDYKLCLLKRVEHLHKQIHIISNATQKLRFTRTCIAKHYLSFCWIYSIFAFMEQKTALKILILNFSKRSCLIRSYKWTFCNILPHQKLCFRGSFLLTSFTVRTVQDCLFYLLLRIYCVSVNWSSRLRNLFARLCLQSNHTLGPASGDGLKNRLSAAYTIWSHV
jgi:hypothetical protein